MQNKAGKATYINTAAFVTLLLSASACGGVNSPTQPKTTSTTGTTQSADANANAGTSSSQPTTPDAADGKTTPAASTPAAPKDASGATTTPPANNAASSTTPAASIAPPPAPTTPASIGTGLLNSLLNSVGAGNLTGLISGLAGGAGAGSTTPTISTATPPAGASLDVLRQSCTDAINQYRATINVAPLTLKADATTAACMDKQAGDDGMSGRAHAHFGACGEMAQDECPDWSGDPGPQQLSCLKMMWAEGPGGGHYNNMSNSSYTKVSCGYATVNGKLWMVQNFFQ